MPRSAKNVYRKCDHGFFDDIRRQQAEREEETDINSLNEPEIEEDDEEDEEDWTCCGQLKSQAKNNLILDETIPIDQKLKLIADEVKQNELNYKSQI